MFLLGKMPRVNDCKLVLCSADFFCIGVLFCFYVHTWGYILFLFNCWLFVFGYCFAGRVTSILEFKNDMDVSACGRG